jgi:hypothetical protein
VIHVDDSTGPLDTNRVAAPYCLHRAGRRIAKVMGTPVRCQRGQGEIGKFSPPGRRIPGAAGKPTGTGPAGAGAETSLWPSDIGSPQRI